MKLVSIRSKKRWLRRAVDQDGFGLEILVHSRRNAKGSQTPNAQAVERQGKRRG
jgi:putative transposase